MSTTRLLVLGAVRIFQPAHGYFIRRELLSWQADEWAKLNPGSIYNALRTLTREGYLVEKAAREGRGGGQSRTEYSLTPDGESHFLGLLRNALWHADIYETSTLLGALSFMRFLTRDEVIDAIDSRIAELRNHIRSYEHVIRDAAVKRTTPPDTAELIGVSVERMRGELTWAEQLGKRLRDGHYRFTPEPGWDSGPRPDGTWHGPLDKPE
jgi:DNA-binding PadR family transcriptional regulator